METTSLATLLTLLVALTSGRFVCPRDGHFGDDDNCSKYYSCANGRPTAASCPSGLFWNRATNQCDWPEKTDCDFSIEKARKILLDEPVNVYLTFDDGPNEGTDEVLDALKKYNVKATFFVNLKTLNPDPKKPEQHIQNANQLVRIIQDGHMLADHSFDHMFHNSNGPNNAYLDLENDIGYFGRRNAKPALDILAQAGASDDLLDYVNYTMSTYVRMPYSNNWRVSVASKPNRLIVHNCPGCTTPHRSGKLAIDIADVMAEKGIQVFGWDIEWNMNFGNGRMRYGGLQMFMRLGASAKTAKDKGKVVILSHDRMFRSHEITGGLSDQQELETFLDLATSAGYQFKTLDYFYSDVV